MSYLIYQSDGTPITVPDSAIDSQFYNPAGGGGVGGPAAGQGVQIVGRNTLDYGAAIAQNFLQLTENFCSGPTTAAVPSDSTALQGQLWFQQTSGTTGSLWVRVTNNNSGGIANWQQLLTSGSGSAASALNIAGGLANEIPYQTAPGVTSFITAPTLASTFLEWNGSAFVWTASGGGGGGTVTSVNVAGAVGQINSVGGPITTSGTITLGLETTGVTAGSYTAANIIVDYYGRITFASSGSGGGGGTVTSVGITPGPGISVSGSPVTISGNITVNNTGVTSFNTRTGAVTLTSVDVTGALGFTPVIQGFWPGLGTNNIHIGWASPILGAQNLVLVVDATSFGNTWPINISGTSGGVTAGFGVGQNWSTPSRAFSVTYTNTTGKPIMVIVSCSTSSGGADINVYVNGALINQQFLVYGQSGTSQTWVVPNGQTYRVTAAAGADAITTWAELS